MEFGTNDFFGSQHMLKIISEVEIKLRWEKIHSTRISSENWYCLLVFIQVFHTKLLARYFRFGWNYFFVFFLLSLLGWSFEFLFLLLTFMFSFRNRVMEWNRMSLIFESISESILPLRNTLLINIKSHFFIESTFSPTHFPQTLKSITIFFQYRLFWWLLLLINFQITTRHLQDIITDGFPSSRVSSTKSYFISHCLSFSYEFL